MKGLNTQGDFDQYGIAGNPMNECANAAMGEHLGQNDQGDFDQLSINTIAGVDIDFGQNFNENYNVQPKNLKGEYLMNGSENQMGEAYELGIMPEYSMGSADYGSMPEGYGIMPQMGGPLTQMGGPYNQMGGQYQQVGSAFSQMGDLIPRGLGSLADTVKANFSANKKMYGIAALLAVGGIVYMKSKGKKLGFAGL